MSLLMDALRKAEADKKQASADKSDASDAIFDITGDDDIDLLETIASPVRTGIAPTKEPTEPAIETSPDSTLALEPLDIERQSPTDSTAELGSTNETPVPAPDPSSTMPTARGVDNQIENYFEDSQALPVPQDDPLAEDNQSQTSDSGITETVASAQTVFEAGTSGPSKRVILWGSVIAIAIGCVFAGAGFYYFHQAPIAHQIPSPSVASNVEKAPPKTLPIVVVEPAPASPGATVATIDPPADIDPSSTAHRTEDTIETPSASLVAVEAQDFPQYVVPEVDATRSAEMQAAEDSIAPPAALISGMDSTPEQVAIDVRPGEVRIARSTPDVDTDSKLQEAYTAYIGGDYAHSQELYQEVLSHRPDQRDGLLGVAALKLRAGEVAEAHRLYRRVLQGDPNNPTASAAMFSLESGQGDQVTESRLKLLLDEGVDVGYIYFSLGNLYARNRRWADAQQAYFEALRNHPTNPDYNYNLAVSLDRIGQRLAAVKYYDAALGYSDARQARFDPAQALTRIQNIGQKPSQ